MAGSLLKRANTWCVRFNVPEARWADVGRAMGARSGIKREIVRTLGTADHSTARQRRDQALAAIRADVEAALAAARLRPLSDWTADWQSHALRRHDELRAEGDRVVRWEDGQQAFSDPVPVYFAEEQRDHVLEEAQEVERRQGPIAARKFIEIASGGGTTVVKALKQWLDGERGKVRGGTIASHEAAFRRLGAYLASHEGITSLEAALLSDVSRRIAGEFLHYRRSTNAAETVMRDFSAFSGLWRWAVRRGYADLNPWTDQTAGLKTRRATEKDRKQERAYSDEEVVKLLQAGAKDLAPTGGGYAATFWDLFRLALLTGARAGELLGLRIGDVVEDETVIVLAATGGKTDSASRIMPLHEIAQRVIRDRLACLPDHKPEASLWPEVPPTGVDQRRSKIIANRYPIIRRRLLGDSTEVDFHSFRRTFMTACETAMHSGGRLNDQIVALLVGHKRDALAFDLYSDWTRLGRVAMTGKLGEKLERLREAVDDVVSLGVAEDVRKVLEETADRRPAMLRVKPAFRRALTLSQSLMSGRS